MYIKFHNTKYELLDNPNLSVSRFQATIAKGGNTFDSILADTFNIENIIILDGEEVKAVYSGYNKRIAISIYEDDSVSIELENNDIQSQIDAISADVTAIQNAQETTDAAIAELGDTVNSVAEVNDTQDAAINDLADVVNELSPTEEV